MAVAIVLLSGGLDSSTCLAIALSQGYTVYPLSFRYGQVHATEIAAARQVAGALGVPASHHQIVDLGRSIRGSALTGDAAIPTGRDVAQMPNKIPVTYVPARNIVFLAHAASLAEALAAESIFIGVNALDYSGYPDCRPEFVAAFQAMLAVGTRAGVEGRPITIETPLLRLTKAEIVHEALRVGVPLALTYSCYAGTRPACGECDACLLRRKGFRDAGVADPIPYRANGTAPSVSG